MGKNTHRRHTEPVGVDAKATWPSTMNVLARLRQTGIDIIGEVPWGTHFCQFYETRRDLIDILVPYFKAGLESNEFCMWVTSEPLGVDDAKQALREAVPDLDRRLADGQIEIIPHTEWYLIDGQFDRDRVLKGWVDKLDAALEHGYSGLRLSGNTFWLEKDDWEGFTHYEEAINNCLGHYPMLAVCTYSVEKCGAAEVADVVANHEFAMMKRQGKWRVITSSSFARATQDLQSALSERERLNEELLAEIDERRRTEDALRASEERLKRSQEIAHLGSWELDLRINKLTWSDEVYRIFGLEPQAFAATYEAFLESVHPDDREAVDAAYSGSMREGKDSYEIEHRIVRRPDGETRIVHERCQHIRDESGQVVRSFGMVHDITERKLVEDALRKTNERLELLSQTAGRLLVTDSPQAEVQRLCEQVMAHLDCHAFFNYLCDDLTHRLHLNAYAGISDDKGREIEWLDYGVAVCGCAARDACRIIAQDIPNTPDPRTDLVKSFGIKAYACHPLLGHEGQVIGTLSFGTKSRTSFSEEDLSLMKTVADQVATAMERIRLHRDAERRAEELQTVMDAVPVAVWIAKDPKCNNIVGNRVANLLYEAEEGENVSANASAARTFLRNGREVTADELPMQYACAHNSVTGEQEFEVLTPGGALRVMSGYASPLHDSEGNVRGCVGAFMDITARKRAEDALREREEHLRLFIEHAPVSLALFDKDMRYLAASKRWLQNYGIEGDVAGLSHYEVFPEISDEWRAVHQRCLAGAVERADEDLFVRADGNVQWLRWEVLPWRQADSTIGGIVIFSEDITERKLAQMALDKYRILAESARDIIMFVAMDGRIVEANDAAVLAYGYTHEEMLGLTIHDLRTASAAGLTVAQMGQADAEGVLFETVHQRKDGTPMPVEVSSRGTDIAGQRVLVSIVRDITERKMTEIEREELYRREHHIAEVLQQALIPPDVPTQLGCLTVGLRYQPATDEAEIGGDFYDVFGLGRGRVGVLMGDVAGKGLRAAIRVAAARYSVRSYAFIDPRPSHVLTLANEALYKDSQEEVNLLTAFFAVVDTITGTLTYATAGHEPPVLCSASGAIKDLERGEVPLGVLEGTVYREHSVLLRPGDSVIIVTDGITEARASGAVLFGKKGMIQYLSNNITSSPDEIAGGLLATATAHAGELQDDAAVVVLRLGCEQPDRSAHG